MSVRWPFAFLLVSLVGTAHFAAEGDVLWSVLSAFDAALFGASVALRLEWRCFHRPWPR